MKVTEAMEDKIYDSKHHLDEAKEIITKALPDGDDEPITTKQVVQVREHLRRTRNSIGELEALIDESIEE